MYLKLQAFPPRLKTNYQFKRGNFPASFCRGNPTVRFCAEGFNRLIIKFWSLILMKNLANFLYNCWILFSEMFPWNFRNTRKVGQYNFQEDFQRGKRNSSWGNLENNISFPKIFCFLYIHFTQSILKRSNKTIPWPILYVIIITWYVP